MRAEAKTPEKIERRLGWAGITRTVDGKEFGEVK